MVSSLESRHQGSSGVLRTMEKEVGGKGREGGGKWVGWVGWCYTLGEDRCNLEKKGMDIVVVNKVGSETVVW